MRTCEGADFYLLRVQGVRSWGLGSGCFRVKRLITASGLIVPRLGSRL